MKPEIGIGAEFCRDKKYRYALWRIWDLNKPLVMLIGLNPSVADGMTDDRTIGRLNGKKGLIYRHGYGGFYMMNLFPIIATKPKNAIKQFEYKIGCDKNDQWLKDVHLHCKDVVFCWGSNKTYGRDVDMIDMFPGALCFGKTQNGSPKHPLFLPGATKLRDF